MSQQQKPEYLGEPTLAQVMRRPVWILALLFALAVAGVFAWLGQWQMSNAVRTGAEPAADTETARPLAAVAEPGTGVTEEGAGVVVRLRGALAPGTLAIVEPRQNGGETGAWVVGRLETAGPDAAAGASLAVAVGWAPDRAAAERARDRLDADARAAEERALEGRFMPPEGPVVPRADEDPQALHAMAPAQLANRWDGVGGPVYSGYLVLHPEGAAGELLATAGLDPIDSVAPLPPESVNWLNVFYAVEWVVFAGFAIFFWFRLTRDAWEKEHELRLLEASGGGGPDPDPSAPR